MEQEERIPPMEQSTAPVDFRARKTVEQVEEQYELAPRFDADGLIVCVTTDAASGTVLMVGYMNRDALTKTIQTGEAHYWSRSRQTLWHKGATSGLIQQVKELRIDDDQDAVWLSVSVPGSGASCHVGYRSCFYRRVAVGEQRAPGDRLLFVEQEKAFEPEEVYGDAPNPTRL